jgi:hypothetical protein
MNKTKQILFGCAAAFLFACNELDVPPLSLLSDADVFGSEEGVTGYISQMYSELPIMQFQKGDLVDQSTMAYSGEALTGDNTNVYYGSTVGGTSFHKVGNWIAEVWNYEKIRRINYFLATLPDYSKRYAKTNFDTWMAEAHFDRAYYYFEMAKRFGGVPIVKEVTNYPEQSVEELKVPRNKEAEVYDFVIAELDSAIAKFPNDPATRIKGRTNRWAAQALKARVALYAGTLAIYGPRYAGGHMYSDGICGVPTERAAEYLKIACEAADAVVKSGHYKLYTSYLDKNPGDYEENFVQIFLDHDNTIETMFAVYYTSTPKNNAHMFDANNRPLQLSVGYVGKASPPMEALEHFETTDGAPFRLTTALTGTDANPVFYKGTEEIFTQAKADPRLRASIMLPGITWMGEQVEVRYGVVPAGGTLSDLAHVDEITEKYEGPAGSHNAPDGTNVMYKTGQSGICNKGTVSGFYVRKFQDPSLDKDHVMNSYSGGGSTTPWPEIRYAEVLLSFAEAAVELKDLGDASYMDAAATHINDIRSRGGAFNRNYTAATLTRDNVRKERRIELYFENKTYWDMVRWRVAHEEINMKEWNLIFPIYFWDGDGDKHYYMKRDSMGQNFRRTFNPRYYYQNIPNTNRNENLVGNPDVAI